MSLTSTDESSAEQEERLITLAETAKRLGICKRSVQRLIARGELPAPVKSVRKPMLFLSDLTGYLERLKQQRNTQGVLS